MRDLDEVSSGLTRTFELNTLFNIITHIQIIINVSWRVSIINYLGSLSTPLEKLERINHNNCCQDKCVEASIYTSVVLITNGLKSLPLS